MARYRLGQVRPNKGSGYQASRESTYMTSTLLPKNKRKIAAAAMTEYPSKRRRIRLSSSCSGLGLVSEEPPSCPHSVFLNDMCIHCNKTVHETFGLAFDCMLPGLRYGYMRYRV